MTNPQSYEVFRTNLFQIVCPEVPELALLLQEIKMHDFKKLELRFLDFIEPNTVQLLHDWKKLDLGKLVVEQLDTSNKVLRTMQFDGWVQGFPVPNLSYTTTDASLLSILFEYHTITYSFEN